MGTCNEAFVSYGITISVPEAVVLLNALRKLPPPPGEPPNTDEVDEQSFVENAYECKEEVEGRIGAQAAQYGLKWDNFTLTNAGEDDDAADLVIYYKELYDSASFYGVCGGQQIQVLGTPWNDEESISPAKLAFQSLAKLPAFEEAGIEVDPTWLLGVSVG